MSAAALVAGWPVVVEQTVAWGDMDAFGHVNNTVYFRYFENARLALLQRVPDLNLAAPVGVGPILGRVEARFRKAVTFPDTLLNAVRVTDISTDRFTLAHLLVSTRQSVVMTEGQGVIVLLDYRTGHKALLTDAQRAVLTALR
jgi:acyl-CoA thioester hydrolase